MLKFKYFLFFVLYQADIILRTFKQTFYFLTAAENNMLMFRKNVVIVDCKLEKIIF